MQEAAAAAAKAAEELYQKAVASADWDAQMRRHFGSPCEACRSRRAPCREHAPPPKDRWTKHYAEMFKDNTPWWTKGVPADYGLQELQGLDSAASSSLRDNCAATAGSSGVQSGSESRIERGVIEQRPGRRGLTTLREM